MEPRPNPLELDTLKHTIENKPHYGYQTQLLIDFYNNGELTNVDKVTVEPRYGYVAAIDYREGGRRILYGHDTGYNAGSSEALAKDKGYSKFMLRELGVNCPDGEEFLLPWWADALRSSERQQENQDITDTGSADKYIQDKLGYPVFVKPVSGSQGTGVRKIHNPAELEETFAEYNQERVKVALVEEALAMPDYRLLVFNGKLVNAYERQPLAVVGDGEQSVEQLIYTLNEYYRSLNRDIHLDDQLPNIQRNIGRSGITLSHVLQLGDKLRLNDISNLSAGGIPRDVSGEINQRWVELAAHIADGFNLQICGVDLACTDITDADSDYSVIEVNATPGARHFMASGEGEQEKLRAMFRDFFNTPPATNF